jgi:hypothetical protein
VLLTGKEISQSIGTRYLYPRDLVTSLECSKIDSSIKLTATMATSMVDTINNTTSEVLDEVIPTIEMPIEALDR